jgi:putative NADPH-quinone reductase
MKILVIKSHTRSDSFCNALADKYILGANEANHDVKSIDLSQIELEKYLKYDHLQPHTPPQELQAYRDMICEAEHIVFAFPTWWGTPPALLSVFIEIVFKAPFAFEYTPNGPKPMLTNKSTSIISTMDSPIEKQVEIVGDLARLKITHLAHFCGMQEPTVSYYGSVKKSDENQKDEWLEDAYKLGKNQK